MLGVRAVGSATAAFHLERERTACHSTRHMVGRLGPLVWLKQDRITRLLTCHPAATAGLNTRPGYIFEHPESSPNDLWAAPTADQTLFVTSGCQAFHRKNGTEGRIEERAT